jgi:hypothetical protein
VALSNEKAETGLEQLRNSLERRIMSKKKTKDKRPFAEGHPIWNS